MFPPDKVTYMILAKFYRMGMFNFGDRLNYWLGKVGSFLRYFLFRILSVGQIPDHIAFIMDGNRRYAKKLKLEEEAGYHAGFLALLSILKYCHELGVKYVTVYAFGIDNFKRKPEAVETIMDLFLKKVNWMLKEDSIVKQYGLRVYFKGNLKLLSEPVRNAAEAVMKATAGNRGMVLTNCMAYASTDEIVHAVHESCMHKLDEIQAWSASQSSNGVVNAVEKVKEINSLIEPDVEESCKDGVDPPVIKLVDVEKHMYMALAPDPGIVIRTSGETRLSNFLLWQTSDCLLYSPAALWPEIRLWHLVWAIFSFQRNLPNLEKKKKLS